MSAIMNGVAAHGGFIPYGGTFLVFSDYARNAVRMAALMRLRVDLRLHARFDRSRRRRPDAPADRAPGEPAGDSAPGRVAALRCGRDRGRLGRRARAPRRSHVPGADAPGGARTRRAAPAQVAAIGRGGYVLIDCDGPPEAIVIATGSEVGIAAEAVRSITAQRAGGCAWCRCRAPASSSARTRPTSRACCRRRSRAAWRSRPARATRGGATSGCTGQVVGIDHFGASAPAKDLFKHFGFTAEHVDAVRSRRCCRVEATRDIKGIRRWQSK